MNTDRCGAQSGGVVAQRGHPCKNPARFLVMVPGGGVAIKVCGVHVRRYRDLDVPYLVRPIEPMGDASASQSSAEPTAGPDSSEDLMEPTAEALAEAQAEILERRFRREWSTISHQLHHADIGLIQALIDTYDRWGDAHPTDTEEDR